MKLLILPGASDPTDEENKLAYDLLVDEAKKRKFDDCIVLNYYGHYSFDEYSFLNIGLTSKLIEEKIKDFEIKEEPYIIFCRCFGCMPFIEFLKSTDLNLQFLKKIIFWGVQPYFVLFKILKSEYEENVFISKKVRINKELFKEIVPFELSINDIPIDINYKIFVTSGVLDITYPEYFHTTLKEINTNNKINFPDRIKNLGHVVKVANDDYFKLIFG